MSTARAVVQVESPYLLEPEAAAFLRVGVDTLQRWRGDGLQKGPRFRYHGKLPVYAVKDLEEWSDRHARTCTTEARAGQPPAP